MASPEGDGMSPGRDEGAYSICVRLAHHTFIRRVARRDFVEGSSGIGGASGLVPPRPVRGFRGVAIVVVAGVLLSAARDSARSSFAISISFRPRGFPDGTCQTFNLPPRFRAF